MIAGKGVRNEGARPAGGAPGRCRADRARAARRRAPTATARTVPRPPGRRGARRRARPTRAAQPRGRVPVRRGQPERALRRWPRGQGTNVARLIDDGHGVRARRDVVPADRHAREPHVDPHRRAPGHHGILNNAWYDRAPASRSSPTPPRPGRGHGPGPGTETIHGAVQRTWAARHRVGQRAVRRRRRLLDVRLLPPGEVPPIPRTPERLPARHRAVRPAVKEYSWSSWSTTWASSRRSGSGGAVPGRDYPLPQFMWVNFTLTDAAIHEGGPYSEIAAASMRDPTPASVRCSRPWSGPACRRDRVLPRGRPRHGGDQPRRAAATGTCPPATRVSPSVTRATGSCTSAWRDRHPGATGGTIVALVAIGITTLAACGGDPRSPETNDGKVTVEGTGDHAKVTIEGEDGRFGHLQPAERYRRRSRARCRCRREDLATAEPRRAAGTAAASSSPTLVRTRVGVRARRNQRYATPARCPPASPVDRTGDTPGLRPRTPTQMQG